MTDTSFETLLNSIRGTQPPRVWSLLVTVFGELAQDKGATISGSVIGQLTALIGIKPEASRVALHRLRKDGWIDSQRTGRSSAYSLTEQGRSQSAAASPLIYSNNSPTEDAWLIVSDPAQPASCPNGIWITSQIAIAPNAAPEPHVFSSKLSETNALPDWMKARLCPPDLIALSEDLSHHLTQLQTQLHHASQLTPLQIATLRVLIVHEWRRIALKAPPLPDNVFPQDWRGTECRQMAHNLLTRLQKPELSDLENSASGLSRQ